MGLADKIVVRVEREKDGWRVYTQSGKVWGPFADEYTLAQDEEIGQRAMNWLSAQGGRPAPPKTTDRTV